MTRTRIFLAIIALVFAIGTATASNTRTKAYPFQLPPEKAVATVEKLHTVSGQKLALTDDERKLFDDARDGKLDKWSFAEACLVASGVTDSAKRKEYLAKIDTIEADARKAIANAKTTREKAEKLLKFLHEGPMNGGYKSEQTNLHTILDTGKFNCVSSAALYNVIGRRLGLELVAIEIPGHVYSRLRDGEKSIDVETTNARGFDPKRTGSSNKGRELDELGLAAVIAYNHGVDLVKGKKYHEGLMANMRALNLDPTSPSAAQNTLASFGNWAITLEKSGKFEEALAIMTAALEVAPKDSQIKNNIKAIYDSWAESFMDKGDWAGAIAIYEKGLAHLPGDSHLKNNLAYCKQEQAKK